MMRGSISTTAALPVLKEFNARATLFAPTYWMSAPAGPADRERFMSWEQLREAARSGLVDVQSHAHRHALVFTSPRVAGVRQPPNPGALRHL